MFNRALMTIFLGLSLLNPCLAARVPEKPTVLLSDSFEKALRPHLEMHYHVKVFPSNRGKVIFKEVLKLPPDQQPHHIIGLDHQAIDHQNHNFINDQDFRIFCYETYGFISRQPLTLVQKNDPSMIGFIKDKSLILPDPRVSNTGLHLLTNLSKEDFTLLKSKIRKLTNRMISAYNLFFNGYGDVLFAYGSTVRALGLSSDHFKPLTEPKSGKPVAVFYLSYTFKRGQKDQVFANLIMNAEVQKALREVAHMHVIKASFDRESFGYETSAAKAVHEKLSQFDDLWIK